MIIPEIKPKTEHKYGVHGARSFFIYVSVILSSKFSGYDK